MDSRFAIGKSLSSPSSGQGTTRIARCCVAAGHRHRLLRHDELLNRGAFETMLEAKDLAQDLRINCDT